MGPGCFIEWLGDLPSCFGKREMRVLNDAEDVSEWVEDRCYSNAAADFLHGGARRSAKADQAVESRLSVRNPPIRHRTGLPAGCAGSVWIEAQFVATHVEAHIEGLIEVRLNLENRGIPRFCFVQIGRVIDDGTKPVEV
jgi:hypothetical protein